MKRNCMRTACVWAGLWLLPLAGAQAQDPSAALSPRSLAEVYAYAVRDSNGDGLADEITARVIVPARPSLQDVEAAANISARIAYETTAASLPVVLTDDEVNPSSAIDLPVLVGRGNRFLDRLVEQGRIDLAALQPGQGMVALVPNAMAGRSALVVAGADDAGTLAASLQVAARLPRLWTLTGIALPAIEQQAVEHLRQEGVEDAIAAVTAIVVDDARRGLFDLRLQVKVAEGQHSRALQVLERLDRSHRRGAGMGTLDYSPVRATTVEVVTPRGLAGQAVVRRVGANWRSLVALPPARPGLSGEALLRAASVEGSAAQAAALPPERRPQCRGCPAFMVDGMLPGGGGGSYSPIAPTQPAAGKSFDLAEIYGINGWLGDAYRDLLPDSTETSILLGGDPREALGAAHIAARLGLESTGITLPLVRHQDSVLHPANELSPILVGRDNVLVQALAHHGRVRLDGLEPGTGVIELVPAAFGKATATVVAGADARGADAASLYLARRLPYVWDTRPGSLSLEGVKTQVADFLAVRSTAGQAVQALEALEEMLADIGPAQAQDAVLTLYLEEADAALEHHVSAALSRQAGLGTVEVRTQAIREQVPVFEAAFGARWEGDTFRALLRDEVLPRLRSGDLVQVQAWLSEDPVVRQGLVEQARMELLQAGAAQADVQVRSAYKQGLFWLTEQVLPALRGREASALHVKVREALPDPAVDERVRQHPARWLKALYPADEIFQRDLGLPLDAFTLELVEQQDVTYVVEARDASGAVVYTDSFQPHLFERDYLEGLPSGSRVQIETGHLRVRINGEEILSVRIATDLERMRDAYVENILPKVREYVLEASNGKPRPDLAPFFRDLRIEGYASEPDYDFGIAAEHMSAAEAMAGELGGVTSTALGAMGAPSAGRIVPFIHAREGRASEAQVRLARNAAARPRMTLSYRRPGQAEPITRVLDLEPIDIQSLQLVRVVARPDGVQNLGIDVTVSDEAVAARVGRAFTRLGRLHAAGVLRTALSFNYVDALEVRILQDEVGRAAAAQTVMVRHAGASQPSNAHVHTRRPQHPVVAWDHVIGPEESEAIIRQLAHYPAVTAYRQARSYEGRDLSVLEIAVPPLGELASMAKLSAYKPTAMVVGRQHGNEPSSTSFILGLAEKLATDPTYRDILRAVNVVLLPVMNPDGAALAEQIRQWRPMDVASPGYLSALAQDVTVSTVLPESAVEPYLWRRWLPDIYLNAHGATSHETPQPLNNHVSVLAPTYAFRRGWYSLGFRVPRDPRHSDWERAALFLRNAMAREIGADTRNRRGNREDYRRFERWGHSFAPHLEPLELHDDAMLFYRDPNQGEWLGMRRLAPPPPNTPEENRNARMGDWPLVTLDGGTYEAADEGARGELFELGIRNGYAATLAHLKYLRDGQYTLQRIEEDAPGDGAKLTTLRVRPVLPPLAKP